MLFDPKIWTTDEVLEILDVAKASLKEGKSVVSWTSLGSSATMQWDLSPVRMIQECTAYLKTVDPATYGRIVKVGRIIHNDI